MPKIFLMIASMSGAFSVGIGAFGAHKLKTLLTVHAKMDVFETAVKYQFYHTLALFLLGILMIRSESVKWFNYAGICFIAGIFIFSGSLYILSLSNVSKWGAVTPVGGLFLIAGWIFLLIGVLKLSEI